MAQNLYDNPEFFKAFRELKESSSGSGRVGGCLTFDGLSKMLPPLGGTAVLDVGCGDGWFTHWAATQGTSSVHGIDISEAQLALAKEKADSIGASGTITFERADLDTVELRPAAYDLIFSSLAMHYVKDIRGLISKLYGALKPGGCLYFTVEHPIFTAPRNRHTCQGTEGTPHWAFTQYYDEGPRVHHWLGMDVEKAHWSTETYINSLLDVGFALVCYREWARSGDGSFGGKSWWMGSDVGPSFLMLGGKKS